MNIDKLIKKTARSQHCLQYNKKIEKYELLYATDLNIMLVQEVSQIIGVEVSPQKISSDELETCLANITKDSSEKIFAEIKSNNLKSISAFKKAGFELNKNIRLI